MVFALSKPVVLKREPLGLLREVFLILGRNFVPRRIWGGKTVDEKHLFLLLAYSTHIKTAQRGWFRLDCLQCARASCFIIIIVWASCFRPLLGCTRSRGRIWAANRLSHHPEPSGRAIHWEVDGLDIRKEHGQRFDLLRHTRKPQTRHTHLCKKRLTPMWRRLSRTRIVLGRAIQGVGAVSRMKVRSLVALLESKEFESGSSRHFAKPSSLVLTALWKLHQLLLHLILRSDSNPSENFRFLQNGQNFLKGIH